MHSVKNETAMLSGTQSTREYMDTAAPAAVYWAMGTGIQKSKALGENFFFISY